MPIRLGKKKYKSFDRAAAAVAKKKGISKERAKAYVAVVDRKQHKKKKWVLDAIIFSQIPPWIILNYYRVGDIGNIISY